MRRLFDELAQRWPFGGIGRRGERAAALHLRRQGLSIVARNLRGARGEIDLVARDGETLVFVEVKSRTVPADADELTGLEKIDRRKRSALRRTCNRFRRMLPDRYQSYRVDGVAVEFEKRRLGRGVREVRWYPSILDLDARS